MKRYSENRFELISGIVDTDTYANVINFPFILKKRNEQFLLKKGEAMVQVIPFKREKWKSIIMMGKDVGELDSRGFANKFSGLMTDFYKILKDTRIQRVIELEEIQTRTKINIIFLKAIENGKFDLLPEPYIRLFLRAYSIEIGLDPEKLLNQFEQFIDGKVTKLKKRGENKSFEKQLTTSEPKSEKEIIFTPLLVAVP